MTAVQVEGSLPSTFGSLTMKKRFCTFCAAPGVWLSEYSGFSRSPEAIITASYLPVATTSGG
ncbi:hypothetical protein D3C72_2144980 [compost metagenome]